MPTYEEVEKRAKEMFGDDMTWGAMDQVERNHWLKKAADELGGIGMDDPKEIARKIINQAMNHESAVETKISIITLALAIEAAIKRAQST